MLPVEEVTDELKELVAIKCHNITANGGETPIAPHHVAAGTPWSADEVEAALDALAEESRHVDVDPRGGVYLLTQLDDECPVCRDRGGFGVCASSRRDDDEGGAVLPRGQ